MKTNKTKIVSILLIVAFAVSSVQVMAQQGRQMRKERAEKRVEKREFRKANVHKPAMQKTMNTKGTNTDSRKCRKV